MGVRRVLRALEVERVNVSADVCRDIDTPEDIAWWESFLSN
nr:MAG TPA: molybdopterin-guanine dinucleotide biosynthesis protein [Caudoviricetes sp.]